MTTSLPHTALRRKIAAHRPAAPLAPERDDASTHAFGRALRRAAIGFDGLGLTLGQVGVDCAQPLQAVIAALPAQCLVAALEDEQGRRGLIGLSPGLVDALIEVQTTGRVEAAELPPRPVTRIDEALTRDFIDLALAAFALEGQSITGRDWPARMTYGSRITARGQINLLLPDGDHTLLQAEIGFDAAPRRAHLVMALPRVPPAVGGDKAGNPVPPDPAWMAARARLLDELHLSLDVVLMRLHHPLAQVERLAVGDLIPFSRADLHAVALEDGQGRVLLHGRLGQIGGRRALRMPPMPDAAPISQPQDAVPDLRNTVQQSALRAAG